VHFGATEKVLGMYWDPHKDVFKFVCRFSRLKRDVLTDPAVPTKKKVRQVLMSIFDPDWRRLYRAVANISLYIQRLQTKCQWTDMPSAVTEFHVTEAQTLLYKEAQRLEFTDEIIH